MNVWLIKEGNLTYSLNYTYLNNFKNHLVCILNAKKCDYDILSIAIPWLLFHLRVGLD